MGLFLGLLTLPLAPVRGVVWLAGQIDEEAQRQLSDPSLVRRELTEIDDAFEAGHLTAEERDAMQDVLVGRLLQAEPFGLGVAGD